MPRPPCPPTLLRAAAITFAVGLVTLIGAASALASGGVGAIAGAAQEAAMPGDGRARDREPNPIAVRPLYVEPYGPARSQERAWKGSRPGDAALIARIADQPQALWLGDWLRDVRGAVAGRIRAARATGSTPVLVAYNIPLRDCGQHSSGGASSAGAYGAWIAQLARGIGSAPAIVVLEPDALAGMGCLPRAARRERLAMISDAVDTLAALPETAVYIDAGNPGWIPARRIATRLRKAGVRHARGFAVNVSGFAPTATATAFGHAVSRRTGAARFIIDTSRNGRGTAGPGEWCNPPDRALGPAPTADTGDPLVDGHLWIKRPGESDGTCNDGPPAGVWWPEYALGLAERAPA